MVRLDTIRTEIDTILFAQKDQALQAEGWVHLYGVAEAAALLASARGLDTNLCIAAGLLHDIYTFRTGEEKDHALHGAQEAGYILRATSAFPDSDINLITGMILRHSDKMSVDTPMDECLKDADVLAHWLYDSEKKFDTAKKSRLMRMFGELGIKGTVRDA